MKKTYVLLLILGGFFPSCSEDLGNAQGISNPDISGEWSIPIAEVRDGGPGKDGIPALLNPQLVSVEDATFLSDTDLVIALKHKDEVRVYPHRILDWHEIINDDLGDLSVAVTYCPLTGTGIGWNRLLEGTDTPTTFGVSGLLYNSNLIPYDRATDSNWTQIGLECVNGALRAQNIGVEFLVETTWRQWKTLYPNSKVVSLNTGFSRDYFRYPYGDYNVNNNNFIFPVAPFDSRLPSKQRVLAVIIDNKAKVYQFPNFENGKVILDSFEGTDLLVIGNQEMMTCFKLSEEQKNLDFSYALNGEAVFEDSDGTVWNIFGEALSGPGEGTRLERVTNFMAFFFSVGAFYTEPEIFEL